jgi:flagellar basal-body rod modification protein FlgD
MAVNGVTSTGTTSTTGSSATSSANQSMGMSTDDFYRLLIAEMRYQDPMQPMDNSKMVEQVAGIRSIESSTAMTKTLETVTKQQNYATAAGLIGKQVTGSVKDTAGKDQEISGVVTRVTFEANGQVVLELNDGANKLPLEAVTKVENAPAASAAAAQQAA